MCPRGRFPLYSATASVRPRKFSSETHGVVRPPTIFATYSGFAEKMHPLGPAGTWAETSKEAQFPTESPPSLGNLTFSAAVRPSALPRGFSRLLKWCTRDVVSSKVVPSATFPFAASRGCTAPAVSLRRHFHRRRRVPAFRNYPYFFCVCALLPAACGA